MQAIWEIDGGALFYIAARKLCHIGLKSILEEHIFFPCIKGQIISKCFFVVFNFFQKRNENKSTWGIIVVNSNSIVLFFWRIQGMTICFRFLLTFMGNPNCFQKKSITKYLICLNFLLSKPPYQPTSIDNPP